MAGISRVSTNGSPKTPNGWKNPEDQSRASTKEGSPHQSYKKGIQWENGRVCGLALSNLQNTFFQNGRQFDILLFLFKLDLDASFTIK